MLVQTTDQPVKRRDQQNPHLTVDLEIVQCSRPAFAVLHRSRVTSVTAFAAHFSIVWMNLVLILNRVLRVPGVPDAADPEVGVLPRGVVPLVCY